MSAAIALLAGLGAGYMKQEDRNREQERQARLDAQADEIYRRGKSEYDLQVSNREKLQAAAAPVPVQEVPQAGPMPDGSAMPPRYKVGANYFAANEEARAEANKQRDTNIVSTQDLIDPAGREQRRTQRLQGQLAEVQLKAGVQRMRDEGSSRALSAALAGASPEQVAQIYNEQGDAKVSNLQITPIEVDHPVLGKRKSVRIAGVDANGKPFEVPDALDMSFRMFKAEKQFELALQKEELDRKAKHDDRSLSLQEERFKQQGANEAAHLAIERARLAALAAKQSAPGDPIRVDLKDMRNFEKDFEGFITSQFPISEAATPGERATMVAQASNARALASTIFRANAELGIPLTAGMVGQALQMAAAPNAKPQIITVGGRSFKGVVVNGQPIIMSSEVVKKPGPVTEYAAPGAEPAPGQKVIDPEIRAAAPGGFIRKSSAATFAQAGAAPTPTPASPPATDARSLYERGGGAARGQTADAESERRDAAQAQADRDPEIIQLRTALANVRRSGDPRQIPVIGSQIANLLKQRYGL